MAHRQRLGWLGGVTALGLLAVAGCQPANPYDVSPSTRFAAAAPPPRSQTETPQEDKKPTPPAPPPEVEVPVDFAWMEPSGAAPDVPIEFIDASRPEWAKLKEYWNEVPGPGPAQTGALTGAPLPGVPLTMTAKVQIRVPLGLEDPTGGYIPSADRPTLGKWKLGKQLFFDPGWLTASGKVSCATCHVPAQGFTNGKDRAALIAGTSAANLMDTSTLLNCVYNRRQFWDGRVANLEDVVQRSLADEREPAPPGEVPPSERGGDRRHAWGGVIGRLRDPARDYISRFKTVFGTLPTQDAVGKALATYQRTLLSGNSVHDRALQRQKARGAASLEWQDYQAVLDPAALEALGSDAGHKDETAKALHTGYGLFYNLGARQANCAHCHTDRNFTDDGFHNLGVGESGRTPFPGKEPGRFASLPVGLKDPAMIGAFKTPTLRGLLQTGPYLHNGSERDLHDVVWMHARGGAMNNPYLDPELRDEKNPAGRRDLKLEESEVHALVLFLKAQSGDALPAVITDPAK
jgi:cytochrome c peroxidase